MTASARRMHEQGAGAGPREGNWCRGWHGTITACSAWPRARRRTRSSGRTASWRGNCIPTSTRIRPPSRSSRRSPRPTRCSPTRPSGRSSTWVGTRSAAAAPGGGAGGMGDPFGGMGLGDIMDAFFGGGGGSAVPRAPVPGAAGRRRADPGRARPSRNARPASPRTWPSTPPRCARSCHGSGCAEGTRPATCDMCKGSGEVQQIQRSLLGQVVTSRPCPVCRGFGEVIPDPCRQCNGEGRVRGPADRAGQHPGRRRRRHPGPAGRSGRGRPRRRRARRPVRRGPGAAARASSPGTASTCTAPCTCR